MVCPPKIKIILLVPNNARENSPQDCMLTLNKGFKNGSSINFLHSSVIMILIVTLKSSWKVSNYFTIFEAIFRRVEIFNNPRTLKNG